MTAFDYVVLGIVACSVLLGFWRGVVGEIIALAAWVLAFFAARFFGAEVGQGLFSTAISDAGLRALAGCALVFILTLVVMALVRMTISRLIRVLGLGLSDRFLGLFFGLARAALFVLALVIVGGMTALPQQAWWAKAKLAPPLEVAVLALRPWLPEAIARRVRFDHAPPAQAPPVTPPAPPVSEPASEPAPPEAASAPVFRDPARILAGE
ncbi:MAG: CvpA family protein [Zoogloeaceae bacterium]|jgi:membrane protein required for colicin V production|nr:CvpA family protein [Zoogloeaceae bacterium]